MARLTGMLLAFKNPASLHGLPCKAAFSLAIGIASTQTAPSEASDFSKAKQIYVPPSRIVRRVDFASMREEVTSVPQRVNYAVKAPTKPKPSTPLGKTVSSAKKVTTPLPQSAAGQSILQAVKSKLDPVTAAKMEATARSLMKSGRLDEAQRVISRLQQMTPEDKALAREVAGLGVTRAQELMKKGDVHEALIATRQALKADPHSTEAQRMLGELHKKSGLDPTSVSDRIKNAHKLYAEGNFQEAEVEYQATLAMQPTSEAHVGLAKVAAGKNSHAVAKQHLEKALEIDSNSATARRELGMLQLQQGDLVGANSELSRALILNPSDTASGSALVKLWQGQVSKLPNANSHLGLARAYQITGDLPAAQAEYRQVVRLDPNHPYLPAARQSFKSQLARQEADKSLKAAKTLDAQGLPRDAYQRLQQAISLSPGDSSYKIYQGELLEKMGMPAKAKEAYLNVLKDDPQNVAAAQRIKGLQAQTGAVPLTRHPEGFPGTKFPLPASGSPLTALTGAAGLVPLTRHPDGFPGTKFPLIADPASIAAGTAATPGLPIAAGGVPVDHVGTLSNFLGSLRGHMTEQKAISQNFEDQIKTVMKGAQPQATEVTEALHSGGGDDLIEKILQSPVGSALPTASGIAASAAPALRPPITGASAAPLMKSLPAAAPQAMSAPPSAPAAFAPSMAPQIAPPVAFAASAPEVASAMQSAPIAAQSAFPAAQSILSSMQSAAPAFTPEQPQFALNQQQFAPQRAAAQQQQWAPQQQQTQFAPQQQQFAAIQQPQFSPPQQAALQQQQFAPAQQQQFVPQQQADTQQQIALPQQSIAQQLSAPLRFELMEIQPGLTDVRLKVLLKNETGRNVSLHDRMRAVIKYRDSHESEVKVAFLGKSVPSGGMLEGIIKVPLSKVDPTADLILRHVSPTSSGDPELHLITAISQR
ncbi:MAG: tetratricopeptide repeat protein [Candidatus Obscuribacterales bacterium]|nr:tetratricopeptide repeat protein [Candidatus Obscuribacterales bacterium]